MARFHLSLLHIQQTRRIRPLKVELEAFSVKLLHLHSKRPDRRRDFKLLLSDLLLLLLQCRVLHRVHNQVELVEHLLTSRQVHPAVEHILR